jgi:hypothetical protein
VCERACLRGVEKEAVEERTDAKTHATSMGVGRRPFPQVFLKADLFSTSSETC